MADLMELFEVLDGWDPKSPPAVIRTNPDPAIDAARLALSDRAEPSDALRQIEDQIQIVRPLVRAARLDLLDFSDPRNTASPEKMKRLAVDLHQYAALLNMKLKCWDAARTNLLQAIAINPDDTTPRFYFAEFYEKTGAFQDAFGLLEDIFDHDVERENGSYQLYLLSLAAQRAGALKEALDCYARLIARSGQDLFVPLARLQVSRLNSGSSGMPPNHEIEALYGSAFDHLKKEQSALAATEFENFLSWCPDHPAGWYGLGAATEAQAQLESGSIDRSLNEADFVRLNQAVRAYQQALLFNPKLVICQIRLAVCFMMLERPSQAVEPIIVAMQAEPHNLVVLMNAARIFLANGDVEGSTRALESLLDIDPGMQEAQDMIHWISRTFPSQGGTSDGS